MKNIKLIFAIAFFIGISGCTDTITEHLDINKDPNNAVESNMTAAVILPSALVNTASTNTNSFGFLNHWMGYWAAPANYSSNGEEQSYNITTNFQGGLFSGMLDNAYDYQFAEIRATAAEEPYFIAICKVMKSFIFTNLVDLYNNVPYSEALKGLEFIRPKYDDGKSVYESAMSEIDLAIGLFKKAHDENKINTNEINSDIAFKGDETAWIRFANTLKLRLLIHQANKSDRQSYITAEIAKINTQGGGFLGSGESANVNPGFIQNKPNPFYASFGFTQTGTQATDFWRANATAMEFLKASNDPRLAGFYKKVVTAFPAGGNEPFSQASPLDYRGNQYGRPINNVDFPYQTANYVSQIGGITTAGPVSASSAGIIKGFDMPLWLITSAEAAFLKAEATQRGWIAGDKEAAYKAAVLESFIWLNINGSKAAATTAFNDWYAQQTDNNNQNVSYEKATDKLKVVLFQKYLALNGTAPLESWTSYRSNGAFPTIPLSLFPGRTSQTLPVRLQYPQREYDLNTAAVQANGSVNQFTSKIWWMN
jgi:hypothetical protein